MSSISLQASIASAEILVDQPEQHLSSIYDKAGDVLRETLAKLAHLDLTQYVQHGSAVMKAHGGYCDVFMGNIILLSLDSVQRGLSFVRKVAIKRLRVHIQSDRDFAKLLAKELHVWSKLDHVNVLPLLGFVLEGDYPSVVSEWIENGTVVQYMKDNPDADPEPLIRGIANGVNYLHQQNVVHSDLKADNVLVSGCGAPLICDFGISRMLASSLTIKETSTGGLKGSVRWMAFELLDITGDNHHTKETDVWAFGMTVYEILTRQIPYSRLKHDVFVMFAILQGELPSFPQCLNDASLSLNLIWKVCEECWVSPPECRVTMAQVVTSLEGLRISPEVKEPSRDGSPTLTSTTSSPVPPLTPDCSSSSSDAPSDGRVSCSPDPQYFPSRKFEFPFSAGHKLYHLQKTPVWGFEGSSSDELPLLRLDSGRAIDGLLLRGSPRLVDFDLHRPIALIRKPVLGVHWAYLNYHDLSRPACDPPCASVRLVTTAIPDWIIEVLCMPCGRRNYVTVKDVLLSVQQLLRLTCEQNEDSDHVKMARDGNSSFSLNEYRFGGLFFRDSRDRLQAWEVDVTHVKSLKTHS